MKNIDSLVQGLHKASDVSEYMQTIDASIARNDLDFLRQLFHEIFQCCSFSNQDWAPAAVCKYIIESIALVEGFKFASAALELANWMKRKPHTGVINFRSLISRLAATQSNETLEKILDQETEIELLGLLVHEAVIRNKLNSNSKAAQRVADRLRVEEHPLASLPLDLLDLELDLDLPFYTSRSCSHSLPFFPINRRQTGANKFVYNDCGAAEKSDHDRLNRVCAAVKNWEIDSNGKVESRLFQLPLQHSLAIAETITGLELDCLSDGNDWTILLETSAKTVFNVLFSAASMGGAYNGGEFAAFGRRTAWQSLGGLVGC